MSSSPEVIRDLTLVDQYERELGSSAFAGRVLLMNFMFTRCPGPCPRLTKLLKDAHSLLPEDVRREVRLLSLSVDAEYDTPAELEKFARSHSVAGPNWYFVALSNQQLELLSQRLTIFDTDGPPVPSAHSLKIYLFDRQGRALQRYDGDVVQAKQLATEIARAARLTPKN